ncbi:MAG: hypothetical protein ABI772_14305, partial [Bacteroidota bacterium]
GNCKPDSMMKTNDALITIVNTSLNEENIHIKLFLDNKLIIDEDSINGYSKKIALNNGLHKIIVLEERAKLRKEISFIHDNKAYPVVISVEFRYNPPRKEAIKIYLEEFKKHNVTNNSIEKDFIKNMEKASWYKEAERSLTIVIAKHEVIN